VPLRFVETALKGVILVEPDIFQDPRGLFFETYHAKKYAQTGIHGPFVQDNFSRSVRSTLRGLHYQLKHGQGKLMTVVEGTVFDVAVDIRRGSPTFGRWVGIELSAENKLQLYIPPGFAHGFCVVSEMAGVTYKCTDFYVPEDECGIIWDDPTIGITWPIAQPLLSVKDRAYRRLADLPADRLPTFRG
jgi:dTDP-4-dehydrorhamnose 3,5-epimerase